MATQRDTLGLSQEDLASEVGVSTYTVQRWEAGLTDPRSRYRRPLAKALQISLVELTRLLKTPSAGLSRLDPSLTAIFSLLDQINPSTNYRYHVSGIKTLSQLQELWRIDAEAYGEANLDYSRYESLWLANKKGLFALYLGGQVIGGFGIWPVPEVWMRAFQSGRVREADLPTTTDEFTGKAPTQHWYISGIVLALKYRGSYAASTLLWESTLTWVVQSSLIYPVNLAAIAISDDGEKLLARYGFALLAPASQMIDGYSLYTRSLGRDDTITLLKKAKTLDQQQAL